MVTERKKLTEHYKSFEETFAILLERAKKESISIETLLHTLSGRGKVLLLMLLSLSLGQLPITAIVLGPFIAYLGLRISLRTNFIWIPKFLLRKKIPSSFLVKSIEKILRFLKFIKRFSKARYVWAVQQPLTRVINGLMIACVGIALAVSPPLPWTGLIGFLAILMIVLGLLNDDGLYILMGWFCSLFYSVFVCFLLKYCSISKIFFLTLFICLFSYYLNFNFTII